MSFRIKWQVGTTCFGSKCLMLDELSAKFNIPPDMSATLPKVLPHGAGSIPILSFTADEIR